MAPSTLKRIASTDRDISPPAKRKVPASATAANVANFFKPASDKVKEPEVVTFETIHNTVLIARYNKANDIHAKHRIAAFDFDDTLVTTSSGNRFSRDAQDWKWWHASVPEKLKQLHQDGIHVVVMSNQGAVKLQPDPKTLKGDMKSLSNFKGKVTSVLTRLDLPITLYAATGADIYRKPRAGMWQLSLKDLGIGDSDVDHENSVFVGDAAGREGDKSKGIRKDHSSSDRDLATNIGIAFKTPEEYFLNEAPQPFSRVFEPSTYLDINPQDVSNGVNPPEPSLAKHDGVNQQNISLAKHAGNNQQDVSLTNQAPINQQDVHLAKQAPTNQLNTFTRQNDVEIVLFCGSPGAGKSTFYWSYLQPLGYERANQDILKTRDKCMSFATAAVETGKSVAVDNTNADVETRASWVALARRLKVPIRLIHFTSPVKLCEHNDTVRALAGESMNPENRKMLPKMAFTGFVARYREPSLEEGFTDITRVDFKFNGSEDQREIWRKHWIS